MKKTKIKLDILSNIKEAKEYKEINELFDTVKNINFFFDLKKHKINTISLKKLRKDNILNSSESEIEKIKQNFPHKKNGFLVVPKIIE